MLPRIYSNFAELSINSCHLLDRPKNMKISLQRMLEEQEKESEEEDDYVPYVSVRDRKRAVLEKHGNRLGILKQEAAAEKYESSSGVESEGEVRSEAEDTNVVSGPATGRSLLDQHSELKKKEEGK